MGTDASRVYVQEGAYTYRSIRLDEVLSEIDSRTSGKECYTTINRTGNNITNVQYYLDIGRTNLSHETNYTYVTGGDGVDRVSTSTTIYYNVDTSEDSRVTVTITRDADDLITDCDAVFTTTEDTKT